MECVCLCFGSVKRGLGSNCTQSIVKETLEQGARKHLKLEKWNGLRIAKDNNDYNNDWQWRTNPKTKGDPNTGNNPKPPSLTPHSLYTHTVPLPIVRNPLNP